ncbi:hypothetical protein Q3G72_001912 [Acer saccharum]|nr:hypothetical protein Q3G72_001912 [Acer saccharum]
MPTSTQVEIRFAIGSDRHDMSPRDVLVQVHTLTLSVKVGRPTTGSGQPVACPRTGADPHPLTDAAHICRCPQSSKPDATAHRHRPPPEDRIADHQTRVRQPGPPPSSNHRRRRCPNRRNRTAPHRPPPPESDRHRPPPTGPPLSTTAAAAVHHL